MPMISRQTMARTLCVSVEPPEPNTTVSMPMISGQAMARTLCVSVEPPESYMTISMPMISGPSVVSTRSGFFAVVSSNAAPSKNVSKLSTCTATASATALKPLEMNKLHDAKASMIKVRPPTMMRMAAPRKNLMLKSTLVLRSSTLDFMFFRRARVALGSAGQ